MQHERERQCGAVERSVTKLNTVPVLNLMSDSVRWHVGNSDNIVARLERTVTAIEVMVNLIGGSFCFLFFGFENSFLRITFLSVCFFFSQFSFYSCYFSGGSFQIFLLENFNSFGK